MNEWVAKSIEIANSAGYLDKLHQVYPVTLEAEREIDSQTKTKLRAVFTTRDTFDLIRLLLKLEKFPVKDPYVAFLRKRPFFIDYNPETVNRIGQRLLAMGFDEMLTGVQEPKEFNRQIGTLFRRWLRTLGYRFVTQGMFERRRSGIAFLEGPNGQLKDYANIELGCNLTKAPDLLVKVKNSYIIGEAKFLTDAGGHQHAQFQDALAMLAGTEGTALRIAVLDGVVWIKDSTKMYRAVCQLNQVALSALLLKDLLTSL